MEEGRASWCLVGWYDFNQLKRIREAEEGAKRGYWTLAVGELRQWLQPHTEGQEGPHRIPSPRVEEALHRLNKAVGSRLYHSLPPLNWPKGLAFGWQWSHWWENITTAGTSPNLPHQPRSRPSLSVDNGTGSFCCTGRSWLQQQEWAEAVTRGREGGRKTARCPSNSALNCFSQPD